MSTDLREKILMKFSLTKMTTCFLLAGFATQLLAQDVPRLPNGKPDMNGIWARPYVSDMGAAGNGRTQTGPGE